MNRIDWLFLSGIFAIGRTVCIDLKRSSAIITLNYRVGAILHFGVFRVTFKYYPIKLSNVREIRGAQNQVRYTMNGFVIAVGTYVRPLLAQAKASAKQIGEVSVDVGDTACQVPLATAYIRKCETAGGVGKKRKTIRC